MARHFFITIVLRVFILGKGRWIRLFLLGILPRLRLSLEVSQGRPQAVAETVFGFAVILARLDSRLHSPNYECESIRLSLRGKRDVHYLHFTVRELHARCAVLDYQSV